MKKVIITAFILVCAITSISYGYTDIENHWAKDSIEKFSNISIINGYGDDTFKPDEYMTRAELVTVINRLLKNYEKSYKYVPDMKSDSWYYDEVRKGLESGIIQGDENRKH